MRVIAVKLSQVLWPNTRSPRSAVTLISALHLPAGQQQQQQQQQQQKQQQQEEVEHGVAQTASLDRANGTEPICKCFWHIQALLAKIFRDMVVDGGSQASVQKNTITAM
jgi:hypothetical protein